MSLIDIQNLTFAYGGSHDPVFDRVSFQLDTGWRLGLIGRNGRGKTTLLNLLMGKYEYAGTISAPCRFQYFPPQVPDPGVTAAQAARGTGADFQDWELERELGLLELDVEVLDRPFGSLSGGEQTKVLLAALFLNGDGFFPLIDEPTNHLDMHGRACVSRYLNGKSGFILVSHDRAFLDGCVDHILAMNKTGADLQRGNFSSWLENKERRDRFELDRNEKLKKDVKRLDAAARRASNWSDKIEKTKYDTRNSGLRPDRGYIGHKAAKMMSRSKSLEARRQAAAEEKSALLKDLESSEALKLSQPDYHSSRLVALEKVSLFYGGKTVCEEVGFTVDRGDRAALCGRNGSGKSSILKLIYGEEIEYTGLFQRGGRLSVSLVPQDTSGLRGGLSDFAREREIDESLFKAILRKLDFSRAQFEKDMGDFSAGQKKKVYIAASLCEKSHLLLWDEPLNFIDVISRMQIEELLLSFQPTILFVEHDKAFCDRVATKIITV